MSYRSWFDAHGKKHREIVDRLMSQGYNKEKIIAYFDFENMVESEPDFCPLYQKNKKCHDLEVLNCYLCACPYFRFDDESMEEVDGKPQYSTCSINSSKGRLGQYGEKIHQDCSGCGVPHKPSFVAKKYHEDWFVPMAKCDAGSSQKSLA